MFGFKSKNKDNNTKSDNYNFPDLDFNPELMDNDQNFDDNELLNELGKLTAQADVDLGTLKGSGVGNFEDDEEPEVTVTEEDMNDPVLLGELAQLSGEDKNSATQPSQTSGNLSPTSGQPVNTSRAVSPPLSTYTEDNASLEAQYPPSERNFDSDRYSLSLSLNQPQSEDESNAPISPKLQMIQAQIETRRNEYRKAALFFKKNNDLTNAREMLAIAKSLDKPLEQVSMGLPLENSFSLPPPPNLKLTPSVPLATAESAKTKKVAQSPKSPIKEAPTNRSIYETLVPKIQSQIDLSTQLASFYLKNNDKVNAVRFHKLKKDLKEQLNKLESNLENSTPPKPLTTDEIISYTFDRSIPDVPPNALELYIGQANNLSCKEIGPKFVDSYVHFDFGWPANSSQGQGDTPVINRNSDPQFNFTQLIPIERTKPFQRHLERKKLTVELFHYRGFLWKSYSIGKAQMRLDRLLKETAVEETVQILDSNTRRPTGGTLNIRLRQRIPLTEPAIIKKQEKWTMLTGFEEEKSVQNDNNAPAENSLPSPTNVASHQDLADKPAEVTSDIESAEPESNAQENVENEMDENESAYYDVNNIVSNVVLSHEIEKLESLPQLEPEQEDRLMSLQAKLQILMLQVQTGQLTLKQYIEQIQSQIVKDKALALKLKRSGKIDLAKGCLRWIKLMENEVNEVLESGVELE